MIALWAIGLGVSAAQNGKAKTGKHSLWTQVIATLISIWLLTEGGFFAGLCQ